MEYGYVKRHYGNKKGAKMQVKSKPFHYVSSDGYDIYVGKNNYQNDELTFKFATGNDWWFHAKKMPGSHVVVKTKDGTLPDRTFEEAGNLAAFYSKGRTAPKVEIDYLQKKNVKKPAGAKPGFCSLLYKLFSDGFTRYCRNPAVILIVTVFPSLHFAYSSEFAKRLLCKPQAAIYIHRSLFQTRSDLRTGVIYEYFKC